MRKSRVTPPAGPNVTIKDIARHLGIADSTVSRALRDHPYTNRETKERVRRAVEKLGYVPHAAARTLRNDKGILVGLILPNISSEAYATAAEILAHRCRNAGLQVVLAISEDDPEIEHGHVAALRAARAAGIVIAPSHAPHEKTVALLRSVPTVQYARHHPDLAAPAVSVDGEQAIAVATEHLLHLGHRRIAYLGPDRQISTGTERLAGFLKAHRHFKVKPDMSMVLHGLMDTDRARAGLTELLQLPTRPSGIIFGAGAPMLGALQAIRSARLDVPGDISIVGYGNPGWYEIWGPGLTTIAQPFAQMANAAASELMRQIAANADGSARSAVTKLDPEFILRGSATRPLPIRAARAM